METWAVVVAAGAGTRFGAAKQFARLGARSVVDWSVGTADATCQGVVVVVPASTPWKAGPTAPMARSVVGGATRSESVRAGLTGVPASADIVVVHDGARPLAPEHLWRDVVAAVASGADGAVPGLALGDTLKRVDEQDRVLETVSREGLVAVQTPQAFRARILRDAHASGAEATDDAALVEAAGGTVLVVEGDPRNLKLTVPADLELARMIVEEP